MSNAYRFEVEFRDGDRVTVRWGDLQADSFRALARLLVVQGVPDGAVAGGRAGRVDWTVASLHRYAAGGGLRADAPGLHPRLVALAQARVADRHDEGGL